MVEKTQRFTETKLARKRSYSQFSTIGISVVLVLLMIRFGSRLSEYFPVILDKKGGGTLLFVLFLLFTGLSLFTSSLFYIRKYLAIGSIQRTSIDSIMKNGLVEIEGKAKAFVLYEPVLGLKKCVWYKFRVDQRTRNGWYKIAEYQPDNSFFMIDDQTGKVTVPSAFMDFFDTDTLDRESVKTTNDMVEIRRIAESHPDLKTTLKPWGFSQWRIQQFCIFPDQEMYAIGKAAESSSNEQNFTSGYSLQNNVWLPCEIALGEEQKILSIVRGKMLTTFFISTALLAVSLYFLQTARTTPSSSRFAGFSQNSFSIPKYEENASFVETADEENDNYKWTASFSSFTSFPIQQPIELDGFSKDQVLNTRRDAVKKVLPNYNYQPFPAIFQEIQDGKPWWGWYGLLFFGSGENSPMGPSFRSNSIVNPLALIWPDLWEMNLKINHLWNMNMIPKDEESAKDFLIQPKIRKIEYDPQQKTITSHYNMTEYGQFISQYTKMNISSGFFVNFEAINARDMGYPFVLFDSIKSTNMKKIKANSNLGIKTAEFYHVGGSCGRQEGCNNLSPFEEPIANYVIDQIPATAEFKLWHKRPAKFGDAADIKYKIFFD